MARSDWKRDEFDELVRRDGLRLLSSPDLNGVTIEWFAVVTEDDYRFIDGDDLSAEAAMDYADTHYPMEREG